MDKKSKIFITGSAGMVGKSMIKLLTQEGYSNLICPTSSQLDLRDQKKTLEFFTREQPDYVFHFAAFVGGIMASITNPVAFFYDNLIISLNVIRSAYETECKKLLNVGSSCIYPRDCPQPMKEEYLLTGKLEPTNEGYALGKIVALKLCETLNEKCGTDFISLMPCNLYGENERFDYERSHVIAGLIMKIADAKEQQQTTIKLWGTGKARREFLYVDDVTRAGLYFMEKYSAKDLGNTFVNIGPGTDISIKELAEHICNVVGYTGEIEWDETKPDGMPQKLMEVSRMKKYGFQTSISLEEGIRKTYQYYMHLPQ